MTDGLPILGHTESHAAIAVDVDRLIGSHLCIVANAGGGKSGLIRRLLEQTHGKLQHIILDVEDEYYTLRERFDYVIAGGDGSDAPAKVDNAEGLALAALRHDFSLITQINDLGPDGAPEFVGRFLNALISSPRELWRPILVVLDEAQRFAPSGGQQTEATGGVRALTGQGRKRGFTAVLASQRIAKIDPNVRGDVNNWLLGRVGQAIDRNTMADALGFTHSQGRQLLPGMAPRSFWAFGPALADEPIQFRVDDVETTPVRPGQAKVPTPPAPEALRAILQGLAPPPEERQAIPVAAGDVRKPDPVQVQELQREVRSLCGDLAEAHIMLEAYEAKIEGARKVALGLWGDLSAAATRALRLAEGLALSADLSSDDANLHESAGSAEEVVPSPPRQPRAGVGEARARPERSTSASPEPGPAAGEQETIRGRKALAALLQRNVGLTERQWAWIAGFSIKGGTWGTYKSALRQAGLVEERNGKWWPTDAAYRLELGEPQPFPMLGPDLVRSWKRKIPGVGRMVDELLKLWPDWTLRVNLADRLNMAAEGGTFGTYISRLASAGLIERQGKRLRIHPEAMEEVR